MPSWYDYIPGGSTVKGLLYPGDAGKGADIASQGAEQASAGYKGMAGALYTPYMGGRDATTQQTSGSTNYAYGAGADGNRNMEDIYGYLRGMYQSPSMMS